MRTRLTIASALVWLTAAAGAAQAATCEDMAKATLRNATVTGATLMAAGTFVAPPAPRVADAAEPDEAGARQAAVGRERLKRTLAALPAFCRVQVTSKPSSDSDIKIEVWLPASGWNGKFQGTGNGGWAGVIGYQALADAVAHGYATANTDTGHVGGTATFALGHPEKLVDNGYRGIHEMTVVGKAVTDQFYAAAPKVAFFNGCSTGGRQALTEAMRYPADYNGIMAGASAIYNMQIHVARVAINAMANRSADSAIPREKYAAVHDAVLNACDALDGVKDGVIDNPLACRFDPKTIQCAGADSPSCLTPPQVETMSRMYEPMKIGNYGTLSPLLQPGTEMSWRTLAGPTPLALSHQAMQYVVFKDPSWTISKFNPARDFDLAMLADSDKVISLTDPNLKPYFDRGGKLIMYHGWQDPQVPAQGSVAYFKDVLKTVGNSAASNSIQLYMMPGMNHCSGGPGPDTFDKMDAIESFVATGKAPAQIVASHLTDGKVDRTRPLCPFGQTAKWKGAGSTDDAANFSCAADASVASR